MDFHLLRPELLWIIPAGVVVLLLLIPRSFVRLPLTPEERRRQRRTRIWIFLSRLLLISLLAVILAGPYAQDVAQTKGNPRVTILIDRSASAELLDTGFADALADSIKGRIPTTVRTISTNLSSDIGSAILRNLEPGNNILLISDGNVNVGPTLEDVVLYAGTLNATVNAINLSAEEEDAAVVVRGPSKVVAESEADFEIVVTATSKRSVRLVVEVDGAKALDKEVPPGTIAFSHQFAKGNHRIVARLQGEDAVAANNAFFKTISVLPKPRILLVTKKAGPTELLLRQLYEVEKRNTLPADLSKYYAVIVDDVPIESIPDTQPLHDYLIDESGDYYGNGLVLFGGLDSFDRGGYSGSSLETLLPVRVGKGERKKGGSNLVFIIDVSGSTGKTKHVLVGGQLVEQEEAVPTVDVIKAQVVNAIEQLKIDNKVGIIVFGVNPTSAGSTVDEVIGQSVRVVAPLDFLYNNRKDLLDRIPRIVGGGPTASDIAFQKAVEMLRSAPGDKHIILMTDGRYSAGMGAESPLKQSMRNIASNGNRLYGINFMTIGVGAVAESEFKTKVDESFLKDLAKAGDGTYDRATKLNTLLIKWGDPKAKEFGEEFSLVPLSLTHFITADVEPTAVLNAYSQVAPKDTAELLVASDSGQPALTVWRYGNGRVAAWTVFAGNNLGQLLNEENSILLSRTVNWAIGDPQRLEPYFVDIPNVRINEEGTIRVQSDSPVSGGGLDFTKEGRFWTARFTPTAEGISTVLNQEYAVNRPTELDRVGLYPGILASVEATGGKVFKPSEADAIVEHVRAVSRRTIVTKRSLVFPFLVAAMGLLLLEIGVRRLRRSR